MPLVIIDTSEIRPGRLDEVKAAMKGLADFVDANEPRPISYNVYFQRGSDRMTVVQLHPDSASAELHLDVAGPGFSRFAALLTLATMDVYGTPSDALVDRLEKKARMLGGAPVVVHDLHAGFDRSASR